MRSALCHLGQQAQCRRLIATLLASVGRRVVSHGVLTHSVTRRHSHQAQRQLPYATLLASVDRSVASDGVLIHSVINHRCQQAQYQLQYVTLLASVDRRVASDGVPLDAHRPQTSRPARPMPTAANHSFYKRWSGCCERWCPDARRHRTSRPQPRASCHLPGFSLALISAWRMMVT